MMTIVSRGVVFGALMASGAPPAGMAPAGPIAAQSCHPAYVNHRGPRLSEVCDLNCEWFYERGISISGIVLANPSNDPHGLGGWNSVEDGFGREGSW